jgi:hypothetical protein
MSYSYCQIDLIESPNRYMYSRFGGLEFLQDYVEMRRACLRILDTVAAVHSTCNMLAGLAAPVFEDWAKMHGCEGAQSFLSGEPRQLMAASDVVLVDLPDPTFDGPIDTAKLLRALVIDQVENAIGGTAADYWWKKVVQRFEVSKKVFERYARPVRDGEGSYEEISIYVSLALLSALRYCRTGSLVALNTLIKVIDTLLSLKERAVSDPAISDGMRALLAIELAIVGELMKSRGVGCAT